MKHRFPWVATVALCLFMLAASLGLWGCGTSGSQTPTTQTTSTHPAATLASTKSRAEPSAQARAEIPTLVAGNTTFAVDLFKATRGTDGTVGKNLVLSPYSLSLALAMTYAGARGETESQMAEVLHFELPQEQLHAAFNALDVHVMASDAEKLTTAASAWVFPPVIGPAAIVRIRPEYLDLLAQNYGAELYHAPADTEEARRIINAWTEEKTQGLIGEILPPGSLPEEWTALVLANATYLKTPWTFTFPAENTRPAPFYLDGGTTVEVSMMTHDVDYGYAEDAVWAAVELPCRGDKGAMERGDISAVFFLPKEGSLDQAVAATAAESLHALVSDMPRGHVAVYLPRFKFDTAIELKEPLMSLGMLDVFDGDRADLSGAYEPVGADEGGSSPSLCVEEIYHGGVIAVDEAGIEAAAGSMVVQVAGIGPEEIAFDRPFLFLIRHAPTGAILFLGQLTNPAEESGSGKQG